MTNKPHLTETSATPTPDRRHGAGLRRTRHLCAAALPLAALLAGCQSTAGHSKPDVCTPTVGMTTAQLAECGCFSPGAQVRYSITARPEDDAQPTQRISIVNYYCPLNVAGMAQVRVANGVATEVFR